MAIFHLVRPKSSIYLQVATLLLQAGAAAGLTLAEIGSAASRPLEGLDEEQSPLEQLCLAARTTVDAGTWRNSDSSDSDIDQVLLCT